MNNTGVLLTNLGTPDAPTARAVRRYLSEFLWDPNVVSLPRPLWWLLLHSFVLRFRPFKTAQLYKKIWTNNGSPLLVYSQKISKHLETSLSKQEPIKVCLGMRYGNPSLTQALQELREQGVKKIIVLPLYPQYSTITTQSTISSVQSIINKWQWKPEVNTISSYADSPEYINAIVNSIKSFWQHHEPSQKLLISFHGMPQQKIQKDPYYEECITTANLIATQLNVPRHRWDVVFQSRFGKTDWLKPYCQDVLKNLPKQGYHRVDVICPGFPVDCLETLEEIAIRNRHIFLEAGGENLRYIPALNDSNQHINALTLLVEQHLYEKGTQ